MLLSLHKGLERYLGVVPQEVTTIGGPWPGVEKWEGGVMAPNGVIYAMPQQSPHVLRIDPGPPASQAASTRTITSNPSVCGPQPRKGMSNMA